MSFSSTGGMATNSNREKGEKEHLSMGEDEEKEILPQELVSPRTWWRKHLNIN